MSTPSDLFTDTEPDLIDRIAQALPEHVRADYYREMSHLRLLPDGDEMLRILRAMQFLALLIEQAPAEMAYEREQLHELLAASLESMQQTHRAGVAYQKLIEQKLEQLPAAIEKGISPEEIAKTIIESLRQHFAATGMPATKETLDLIAKGLKKSTEDFQKTATSLNEAYTGIAAKAETAIAKIETSIGTATYSADHSIKKLEATLVGFRKWLIIISSSLALGLGLAIGGLFVGWYLHAPSPSTPQSALVIQPTLQQLPALPADPSKPTHKKHVPMHPALKNPTQP